MSHKTFSKSWIKTTLSLTAIALGACARPPQAVWVDVASVAAPPIYILPWRDLPLEKKLQIPGLAAGLPAVGASSLGTEQMRLRREEAVTLMRGQLAATVSEFESVFRRELLNEAGLYERSVLELVDEERRAEAAASAVKIARIIQRSATERGGLLARLALLAGWPDAKRVRVYPLAQKSRIAEQWAAEAQVVRTKIAALDASLDLQIEEVLQADVFQSAERRATILEAIQQRRRQIDATASARATARVRERGRFELPRLLSHAGARLPAQPAESVTLPSAIVHLAAAETPPAPPAPIVAMRHRLNIWLQIHGYKLADAPTGVPDKTGEFALWIKQQ